MASSRQLKGKQGGPPGHLSGSSWRSLGIPQKEKHHTGAAWQTSQEENILQAQLGRPPRKQIHTSRPQDFVQGRLGKTTALKKQTTPRLRKPGGANAFWGFSEPSSPGMWLQEGKPKEKTKNSFGVSPGLRQVGSIKMVPKIALVRMGPST